MGKAQHCMSFSAFDTLRGLFEPWTSALPFVKISTSNAASQAAVSFVHLLTFDCHVILWTLYRLLSSTLLVFHT
ncbi:hypothetical protein SETIT_9G131500v2 [Setaria italica]|uniref:Uncharacterized protein n=2 Tax=Setaria TaxID=4554 RepID=A0A368SG17_SETIT|nr:hypothetical protein SETIT_9G131500v2 [Setaria italica]TKV91931.1 hypothetical protein SEVIR_9G130200v2 [Setaria viridis]